MDAGELDLELPDADLRRLSLAAGMMARIAHVDEKLSEAETKNIALVLSTEWQVDYAAAEFITDVALSEISPEMDYYRLTRSFFEQTSEAERIAFLDVLFAVSAADGFVSATEIEEIRALSIGLKLLHQDFINAKLKIPREQRAN
jgi:uncharacterized tellurite resistance protein B-like protein